MDRSGKTVCLRGSEIKRSKHFSFNADICQGRVKRGWSFTAPQVYSTQAVIQVQWVTCFTPLGEDKYPPFVLMTKDRRV